MSILLLRLGEDLQGKADCRPYLSSD